MYRYFINIKCGHQEVNICQTSVNCNSIQRSFIYFIWRDGTIYICMCVAIWHFSNPLKWKSKAKSRLLTSCCSTTFNGFFDLVLVLPAEVRIPSDVSSGLSCCSLPEAREVVPVRDFPIKHGGLPDKDKTGKIQCLFTESQQGHGMNLRRSYWTVLDLWGKIFILYDSYIFILWNRLQCNICDTQIKSFVVYKDLGYIDLWKITSVYILMLEKMYQKSKICVRGYIQIHYKTL